MSLTSYKCPTLDVPLDDHEKITVRGLSSGMVQQLMDVHHNELEILFSSVAAIIKIASNSDENDFALRAGESLFDLIKVAPDMIGTIIAMSAQGETGAPEEVLAAAMNLPIGVQFDILMSIAKLTIKDVGAIKKMRGELGQIGAVFAVEEAINKPGKTKTPKPKKAG